jgi:chemotaxis signal transduction protein
MTVGRASELRTAFDQSFAELPNEATVHVENFLAIRIGSDPFAMRLRDVAGLYADRAITSLPSPVSELVGIAGFRGGLVPVYDLRALLGYPTSEPTRWLVLVTTQLEPSAPPTPVALAFDRFDGHLRVSPDAITTGASDGRIAYVRELVSVEGGPRPIVDVGSLLDSITKRAQREQKHS